MWETKRLASIEQEFSTLLVWETQKYLFWNMTCVGFESFVFVVSAF